VGLVLDGRGRLKDERGRARLAALPTVESERRTKLGEWVAALKMYPRAV
jgi:hypothetical protein